MRLTYERYLDQVLGGWIGNSMGGAIGARFEGISGGLKSVPTRCSRRNYRRTMT